MTQFCQYSDAFGPPGQGLHTHIGGIAMFDVLLTLIGAYLIQMLFAKLNVKAHYMYFLVGLFVLSVFLHYTFCVCTTVTMMLFPMPMCSSDTSADLMNASAGTGLDEL